MSLSKSDVNYLAAESDAKQADFPEFLLFVNVSSAKAAWLRIQGMHLRLVKFLLR
jgi:hypothetical protein